MFLSRPLLSRVNVAQKTFLRHVSTDLSQKNIGISPVKLRALISLYHQGDTFITPENLSQKIDEAFIKNKPDLVSSAETEVVGIKDMEDKLHSLRDAPKVKELGGETKSVSNEPRSQSRTWSEEETGRIRKVRGALYGVEEGREEHVLPGLEVLLEELARLERDKEADERRETSDTTPV